MDARVQRVSVKSALPTNLTYIGHCLGQVESVTYIGGEICGSRPEAALQAFSLGHVEELHKYEACFQVWEFCFQKKQPTSIEVSMVDKERYDQKGRHGMHLDAKRSTHSPKTLASGAHIVSSGFRGGRGNGGCEVPAPTMARVRL